MKAEQLKLTAALFAATAVMTFALAAAPTLKVGDRAPKLQTGKWVQGEPVKDFEKFKDKGLIVIGQDCSERDESQVAPFVKKMGDKMTYRVALDDKTSDKQGQMSKTWMEAAGQNGIPTAFLVDTKGVIAWIGHPMELKEQVIEDVLAGKTPVSKGAESN
jgi:hypothetical protein